MQARVPLSAESVARNRAIFLYHLRINPGNVKQITGVLKRSAEEMCAVGLGCDAFNIPMTSWEATAAGKSQEFDPYAELAHKLGVSQSTVAGLYGLNDGRGLSFEDVARVAQVYFDTNGVKSPGAIWADIKKEEN